MMTRIGFIGFGTMAKSIKQGLELSSFPHVTIYTRKEPDANSTSLADLVLRSDILFLAIKPQQLSIFVDSISSEVSFSGKVLISMLAGTSSSKLADVFKGGSIVRIMPNTAAEVGQSTTLVSLEDLQKLAHPEVVMDCLKGFGRVFEIPESLFNVGTALSGSGPAFVYRFIESMEKAAVAQGMDPSLAVDLLKSVLKGCSELISSSDKHFSMLREDITSKGGTTAAGLRVLQDQGLDELLDTVFNEARNRSQQLEELS